MRDASSRRLWARFDDLQSGTAVTFPAVRRSLVAERAEDVAAVLQEVQRATEAGHWAFGYVAYEAASGLDRTLTVHPASAEAMPLVWFGLTDQPVPTRPLDAAGTPPAQRPLHRTAADRHASDGDAESGYSASWYPTWRPGQHRRDVERVRERIGRGDTYQCNLTVRMHGRVGGDPLRLYRDLALGQRGGHNAYLDLGRFVIASASPELFFQRVGNDLLLRPMKGTAPRGRNLFEDRQRARVLCNSAKERAENVMIVDLIRNDVARVSEIGGVRVRELCRVERYETVLQLTSDIAAKLRPRVGLHDLFRVLFPSGSVTGAPKASTMALIRELEPTPRGVYCGAIGFVGPPDAQVQSRFNVAIRTAVVDRDTGRAVYGVGGGITWSSEAAAEHAEVLAKTAILHRRHQDFELIETMRYAPERGLRNRDRHLRRIADSAEYFGFSFDSSSARNELRARLVGRGPSRVRLLLRRDGRVVIDLSALPPTTGRVTLAVDVEPVDSSTSWLYHKTTLRQPYERRRLRHPDVDDVIMINEHEELTEVTRANLAVQLDGRWWTPPLSSGCLPGVERARLLDRGRLRERVIHVSDLHWAERIAVVNSLRGWRCAAVVSSVGAAPRVGLPSRSLRRLEGL